LDNVPCSEKGKEQLLGTEGYIADKYFSGLKKFYRFPGRKPQGRDQFNSVLNYGYGILYNEVERACLYVGLDPYLGLYHSERYGKPALVLDLVEEFRVPIVDSVLFPLFIEKKLSQRKYFEKTAVGQYLLSPEGKSVVVGAIMKRLNETTAWRGKQYTLKQIIDNQIRALARHFVEKEDKYNPFRAEKLFSLT
jgi:CRISPR-associated protein Cas1